MTVEGDLLPRSQVEDLVRALVRAFRAFQMYLPNNPMYQRADEGLRDGFAPLWEVLDEVTFAIDETQLVWEEQVVYDQPSRSESFAWWLYKDGMRQLSLRRGVEEEEMSRFLHTVSQARLLPVDASDDLLTLLWSQEFSRIRYQFAEVVSDPWVYDPQALSLEAADSSPEATRRRIQEEAQVEPRPQGMVDIEDFDSTLYFLDEVEIAALIGQVEEEYRRDVRGAALSTLFDSFELYGEEEVRNEILAVLEMLFPNLLVRGEFRTIALILRELRAIGERLRGLHPEVSDRLARFAAQLSEPATIAQLLHSLDEAADLPPESDLGELLRELRAPALGAILATLPGLASEKVRTIVGAAAERLGQANSSRLVELLQELPDDALPGAIQLVGRLNLYGAVPQLAVHVRHASPAVRLAAVETLGGFGTPGALAALEPSLDDGDRAVRGAALSAVMHRLYQAAARRLATAVQGKGPVELERGERRQVFEAYAVVAGPPAIDVLRQVLIRGGLFRRKASVESRTCAVYALGKIRTPEARAVLEQVEQDKDLPVRHAAASLLREWPR